MPYRKRTYNKRGKRWAKKAPKNKGKYAKNRRNAPVTTVMKGMGFADSMYVKLDYAQLMSVTDALPGTYVNFRGNSLYDPDVATGGHQPMYFDQYAAIYSRYRVMGSAIRLDVVNQSGDAGLYYIVEPNTNQTGISATLSELLEQSRAGAPKFVPIAQRVSSRYKRYASTRKVCGLTKTQIYDDTFASSVTGNPNNLWYWNVHFYSANGTSSIVAYVVVRLVYYIQFFDKVQAPQS